MGHTGKIDEYPSDQRSKVYYYILFIAAIAYTVTAFNSRGYFHADEHFQIIEFARLKLGLNSPDHMPWEYGDQIRSTIQPVICLIVFKLLYALNISDPYLLSFFVRLLSALFALYSIHLFIIHTSPFIKNRYLRITYSLLSFFIWFVPFISVRFSSETWAGLIFLSSLTVYFNNRIQAKKYFFIGCLLALSFLFRFQMAFAAVGFILWLILVNKNSIKQIGQLFLGGSLILVIGTLVDCWFYGNFVFTPWNYFNANIIQGVASEFGTSPWYAYICDLFILPGFPFGILILLCILTLILTEPKSVYVWCLLPFILLHSIVPHKEDRFLFPLVYLLAFILCSAYQKWMYFLKPRLLKGITYLIILILIPVNLTGLTAMGTRAPAIGKMEIVFYIHSHYPSSTVNLIFCAYADAYDMHVGVRPYLDENVHVREINNLCELSDSLLVPEAKNILVIRKENLRMMSCSATIPDKHFVLKKQSIPKWLEWLNDNIYFGFDSLSIMELYEQEN